MTDNISNTRNKFVILGIVNIVQPVKKRSLVKLLKPEFAKKDIDDTLKQLIKEDRIIKEADKYRLTNYGLKTVLPGEARKLRDKHRMHYLYEIWKNRGDVL